MTRPIVLVASVAGCLLALVSCSASHGSEGPPTDAGPPPADAFLFSADSAPALDADAGICAPYDARGQGACRAIVGYAWRYGVCDPVTGCECVGADCSRLSPTPEACIALHAGCERICGGFAEIDGCLPTEFCDYPDASFCGGDDSAGVCTARPPDCPEPGGVTVCGCDRREYIGECSAYLAGVDVARVGPCVTSSAYRTAKAERDCGPADGPAWTLTLSTDRSTCDEVRADGTISISVWHELEVAAHDTTYTIGSIAGSLGDGQASVCGGPGAPCATATGTVVFHVFAVGEVARFDYDLRTSDGRRFAETDVEVSRFWCRLTSPGCG